MGTVTACGRVRPQAKPLPGKSLSEFVGTVTAFASSEFSPNDEYAQNDFDLGKLDNVLNFGHNKAAPGTPNAADLGREEVKVSVCVRFFWVIQVITG